MHVIGMALLATLSLVLVALVAWCLIKLYRMHTMLYELKDHIIKINGESFRQIEALLGLYKDLDFEFALPHTRGFAASPDFLGVVHETIKRKAPNVVVECSSGMSTLIAAKALQQLGTGHVYSLESDKYYCDQTQALLDKHNVSDWATVIHAPLNPTEINGVSYQWYDASALSQLEDVELMVIDGPFAGVNPLARYPAGPKLLPLLAEGGEVLIDDYQRADEKKMVQLWLDQFPDLEKQDVTCEKGCMRLINSAKMPRQAGLQQSVREAASLAERRINLTH
ncbi:class I SAM-dependent methyltransferase [Pseudomaricurvus sp.]|uniref:class I SAM-dependent methyltransferase n=1 Tax=Pseudomaricurvus sp. TaxID=2004510 RepID=UPI003F6B9831